MKQITIGLLLLIGLASINSGQATEQDDALTLAKHTLLQHLAAKRLAAEQLRVISIEAVQWPDSSLGCPRPGMAYAQVITPGYRIQLELDGEFYPVHVAGRHAVVCH
jgi:hypothetical protein